MLSTNLICCHKCMHMCIQKFEFSCEYWCCCLWLAVTPLHHLANIPVQMMMFYDASRYPSPFSTTTYKPIYPTEWPHIKYKLSLLEDVLKKDWSPTLQLTHYTTMDPSHVGITGKWARWSCKEGLQIIANPTHTWFYNRKKHY